MRALKTLILVLLVTATAASAAVASGGQNPGPGSPNPLVGQRWWDQNTPFHPTWQAYRSLRAQGRTRDARDIRRLAQQPQFRWWGQYENPIDSKLRGSFQNMDRQGRGLVPLLAAFGHEGKSCGPRYQGGGRAADARYRRFIRGFARGVGRREAVIAFEPDSLGTVECLAKGRRRARLRMLRYGVTVLSRLPNATVYIDAGASDWKPVSEMARKLRAVGVKRVRGFMLNATHQDSTARNLRYGAKLSKRLGGKHFIVNTSHNGNGRFRRNGRLVWCNPPNAAAGIRPTTRTGHPKADAYMWIERPGYSNGSCNGGPARVGAFWVKRALQMVRRAKWY